MIFRDYLKDIVEGVDGALAATMMADDGVMVAEYYAPGQPKTDIQNLAIEFCAMLKETSRLCKNLLQGEAEELLVGNANYGLLFTPVHDNYFVALLMKRGANTGKGRFLLRQYRPKIIKEL